MTQFNESQFDRLQDYAQEGFKGELNEEEQNYYNALLAQLGAYRHTDDGRGGQPLLCG